MLLKFKRSFKLCSNFKLDKSLYSVFVAVVGLFSFCSSQLSFCNIRDDYKKCMERKAFLEKEIKIRNKNISESRTRGLALKRSVDKKSAEISFAESKLEATRDSISQIQADIKKLEEDSERCYNELGDVLFRGYRSSDDFDIGSFLNFNVLSDNDLDDCVFCNSLGDYGKQIVDNIHKNKLELEDKRKRLLEDVRSEENLKVELGKQKNSLENEERANAKNTDKMLKEQNSAHSRLSQLEIERRKLEEHLSRIQVEHSKNSKLVRGNGRYIWPVNGPVTSPFGWRKRFKRMHKGLDIGAACGTPVKAAIDGTVITVGYDAHGWGNYVMIDHGSGYATLYGHLSSACVKSGQKVQTGQSIGKVGMTGRTNGPHLHFETLKNGVRYDPRSEL